MNMGSYSCYSGDSDRTKQISSLSSFLKIVSEESKLKLLCILSKNEQCVCEIMEHANLSQSLISHHLKDLKDVGVVVDEKRGLRVYYSLTKKGTYIVNILFSISQKGVDKL